MPNKTCGLKKKVLPNIAGCHSLVNLITFFHIHLYLSFLTIYVFIFLYKLSFCIYFFSIHVPLYASLFPFKFPLHVFPVSIYDFL